jgi:hypothetical protein
MREPKLILGPELVKPAAQSLWLSARTIRRLITRYTASAQTTSLIDLARHPMVGFRQTAPTVALPR